jgi:DDE superfamily endonuclease
VKRKTCQARRVFKTQTLAPLRHFRRELYDLLGLRQDSLFELVDAVLTAAGPATLVRHSLSPYFRRGWSSTCDALSDGSLDTRGLRHLFVQSLPTPDRGERELWAVDGTAWPRPAATTSPDRTWEYRPLAGKPQKHLVPAWEYQWLVALPDAQRSWMLPLDVRRRAVARGTPTELVIDQLHSVVAERSPHAPRPVVLLDSQYAPGELAQAALAVDMLVRLPRRRRLFGAPGPYRGLGAPRKHGRVFRLHAASSHWTPDEVIETSDAVHGAVSVAVWHDVHDQAWPTAPFALVRISVERLPRHTRTPEPLWLAWIGGALPDDLLDLWRWYRRRFTIEHGFRFCKHDLGWTTIRPRQPQAADRWTCLLAAGLCQLWLARHLVADQQLPWEAPLHPARLTPGRVRRAFAALLVDVGSPARAPKMRGKSPGRLPNAPLHAREHYPVVYRKPAHDRRCHCPHHRRHSQAA